MIFKLKKRDTLTMDNLLNHIKSKVNIDQNDIDLMKSRFVAQEIPANTTILDAGKVEQYIYFLASGIVKGYQNIDGKLVVQHLVEEGDFFTSLESFMTETPSLDYYESITECEVIKISKPDFDYLQNETAFWAVFVKDVTNEHLNCKLKRVKDFQTLTAKERYLKFLNQHPKLALNVSVDNIASFLGMEPQSLSRIRKQIAF